MQGEVEAQYLYATMLGSQLLPFGFTRLSTVVLPVEESLTGVRVVKKETALGKGHWGLHRWVGSAESIWKERKKVGTREDIYQWLDYRRKLTSQNLRGYHTVLYSRAGTNLASCVVSEADVKGTELDVAGFVADTDTYYYQSKNETEVHYLCSFLNAGYVDKAIKPFQTRGAWGERDIHRRPFEVVSIPKFNPEDEKHRKLAELSQVCHQRVKKLKLEGKSIGNLRGKVRKALANELAEIDKLVNGILSGGTA